MVRKRLRQSRSQPFAAGGRGSGGIPPAACRRRGRRCPLNLALVCGFAWRWPQPSLALTRRPRPTAFGVRRGIAFGFSSGNALAILQTSKTNRRADPLAGARPQAEAEGSRGRQDLSAEGGKGRRRAPTTPQKPGAFGISPCWTARLDAVAVQMNSSSIRQKRGL